MAYTQDDLTAIETAIKSGALTVEYADKKVTYRSLAEMLRIRDIIRKALGLTNTSGRVLTNFDKGVK